MNKLFKYALTNKYSNGGGIDIKADAPLPCLFLLLAGALEIEYSFSGEAISSKVNYFYEDLRIEDEASTSEPHTLISDDIDHDTLIKYLNSYKNSHYSFFSNLLDEVSYCMFLMHKERHTNAFIHLYRALEAISFAFPAIYIASSNDFAGSYKFFQDFFKESGSDAGELAFFRQFVKKVLDGDPVLETSIDFQIDCESTEVCESVLSEVRRVTEKSIKANVDLPSSSVSVKFEDVCPFVITLRNRYFHNSSSGIKNMQIGKLIDPDILYKAIVGKSLYCVATILSVIIRKQIQMLRV